MAVVQLDYQYLYVTEYWTQTFHILVPSLGSATPIIDDMIPILCSGVQNAVLLEKVRIRDVATPANYVDRSINLFGTGGPVAPAPLFNVVRWALRTASGRPVNQYYRGGVTPSNIGDNQAFTPTAQAFNQALLDDLFAATEGWCKPNGDPYLSAVAIAKVGMRQLRRGSRRRTTPVI